MQTDGIFADENGILLNMVHTSDSQESAAYEISVLFDQAKVVQTV